MTRPKFALALAVTAAVTMAYSPTARADTSTTPDLSGPKYKIVVRVLIGPHDNTPIESYSYNHAPFDDLEACTKFMNNDPEFRLSLPGAAAVIAKIVEAHPGSVPDLSCQPVGEQV